MPANSTITKYLLLFTFALPLWCSAQSLFLPNTMSDKRQGKVINEDVVFYSYPFKNNKVDIRDFKKKHPNLKAPNYIEIIEPAVTNSNDLTVLIGLIKGVQANEEALVIWLAEGFDQNEVTFYLDKDLDRDFTTDMEVKVLRPSDPIYSVRIKPFRGNIPEQQLSLKVPRKKGEPIVNIRKKSKIYNQLAIGIFGGAGTGSLKYDYNNLEKGFPTWYSINFSSKGLGTSLSYSTKNINFELSANYQNIYSYTSYLNIRFDNPEIRIDANGNRRKVDNVQVETNFDRHSQHRFQYGFNLGFRMHFNKAIEMQPYIGVGQTIHGNRQYNSDRFNESNTFQLDPMLFVQGGLRFEFLAKTDRTFFIDLYFQQNQWQPEGYFEQIPHDNLRVDHRMCLFGFGYRIGL